MTEMTSGRALRAPILIVGALVLVVATAMIVSYQWTTGGGQSQAIEPWTKVIAVWATLIAATLGATTSLYVAHRQATAALQLEQARKEIAEDLERVKQEGNQQLEITRSQLATKLEAVRLDGSRSLELLKGRHAARRNAFEELLGAMYYYYYTVAELEEGRFDVKAIRKADNGMVKACRYLGAVPTAEHEKWERFWQSARAAGEAARTTGKGLTSDEVRKRREALWTEFLLPLGTSLEDILAAAAENHGAT